MTVDELNVRTDSLCSSAGLNHQHAFELAMVASSALGRQFIESPVYVTERLTLERMIAHPLLRVLDCSDALELGLREFLALGLYLKTLARDPALSSLLHSLRNPRLYATSFFQLAVAHRISAVGGKPSLEPLTQRGKADIFFTFGDRTYVAECYRPARDFLDYIGRFETLLAERLVDGTPEGRVLRLSVNLKNVLSYDAMRRLLRLFDDLLVTFLSETASRSATEQSYASLVLEDITNTKDDPDTDDAASDGSRYLTVFGRNFSVGSLEELDQRRQEQPVPPRICSRVRVAQVGEKKWPMTPWETLEARVGEKLKQTKAAENNIGRLLFVEFPWGVGSPDQIIRDSRKVHEAFVRRFPEVSGVVIMQREPLSIMPRYSVAVLLGRSEVAVSDELIDRLHEVEMHTPLE